MFAPKQMTDLMSDRKAVTTAPTLLTTTKVGIDDHEATLRPLDLFI